MNEFLSKTALFITAVVLGMGAYSLQSAALRRQPSPQPTAVTLLAAEDDSPLAPKPTGSSVVTAAASLSEVSEGAFDLRVAVRIAPGWHISAMEQGNESAGGFSAPTTLDIELPRGLEQIESWSVPEPELDASGAGLVARVYTGDVRFRCRLQQTAEAVTDPFPIRCRLGYQACNRFSCKPFKTVTLAASIKAPNQNQQE